ncbi:MAG: 50S ribosomal protein L6 [Candidatus Marinimicrobia bacterium]|nr:50S ribosomal protein L6 [Candidatus Neomarinimicrobiota bacterium]|tara:strand:+ start:22537 stop:23082 length:546 start_codon:yes stop_codon:yes gene_type:complete
MSNIGKQPISVPDGVSVNLNQNIISIKGSLGELSLEFDSEISVKYEDNQILVNRPSNNKKHKEFHGLYRALIQNMVMGVTQGFSKELSLVGVGYTAEKKGNFLIVNAGYSHPVYMEIPDVLAVDVPSVTSIVVKGASKQNVGDMAAKIREIRKPEPYKGKGIRYIDEYVRRKAGKTVGGTG